MPGIEFHLKMVGSGFRVVSRSDESQSAVKGRRSLDSLADAKDVGGTTDDMETVDELKPTCERDEDKEGLDSKSESKDTAGVKSRSGSRSSIGSKDVTASTAVGAKGSVKLLVCQSQLGTSANVPWDYRFAWEFAFSEVTGHQ